MKNLDLKAEITAMRDRAIHPRELGALVALRLRKARLPKTVYEPFFYVQSWPDLDRKLDKFYASCDMQTTVVQIDYAKAEQHIATFTEERDKMLKELDISLQLFGQCGNDIHKANACKLFNLEPDQVTDEHRKLSKAHLFRKLYGRKPE